MKLYLAGPLFTIQEREWNARLGVIVRRTGHEAFVPQEEEPITGGPALFEHDMEGLRWCDAVLANLDGPTVDAGTAWECGWAVARHKPVYGYRTDFRGGERGAVVNNMLANSCSRILVVSSQEASKEKLEDVLETFLRLL